MDSLQLKALAKINLGLDVLGRRDDGYHDVRMVMQTIYLYDDVIITKTKEPGIQIQTNLYYLPVNDQNIAYKAAKLLMDEFGITEGVSIVLKKHIPVAAGLAGGSANAAAVLFGINRMFSLGLTEKGLMERGVTLGADVPYSIKRGTILAEGIGEKLKTLPPMPKCYILIAKPAFSVSTRKVYEKLDAASIVKHPNIDGIIKGLEDGDLKQIVASMGNVLEEVTIGDYPIIAQIKEEMIKAGALGAMMSGSGPTVFGVFVERKKANEAYRQIKKEKLAKQVYLANVHTARRK